jgi:predicted RNA binding protein YcfA (HicA-like mRNA interferase family)
MSKLPRVSARELIAALRRDGWTTVRQSGGHMQLKHHAKPGKVTVPIHGSQTLPVDLVSAVLKQAGLTADELRDLL